MLAISRHPVFGREIRTLAIFDRANGCHLTVKVLADRGFIEWGEEFLPTGSMYFNGQTPKA